MDEQTLWFCPLPAKAISTATSGSLAHTMGERYATYQKGARHFFSETLEGASRHVLLVDVLEALAEGQHAFYETAAVLGEVYSVLADRRVGLYRWLFGRSNFEKVLLVATKADTVPPNQRAALSSLLEIMCANTLTGAAYIAKPDAMHVAAIRATRDVTQQMDGAEVKVVQGLCSVLRKQVRVTMIDIPDTMPDAEDFKTREGVRTPRFVPPKVEVGGRLGVPNARLGMVLDALIGDLLQ